MKFQTVSFFYTSGATQKFPKFECRAKTACSTVVGRIAVNFCRLHPFQPQKFDNSTLFFFGALQQRSRRLGNSLSGLMRVMR
jgi:hypothetical protein